jgi:hypothetical protein
LTMSINARATPAESLAEVRDVSVPTCHRTQFHLTK